MIDSDPLDLQRNEVLSALLEEVPFEGWSADTLDRLAGEARPVLFPRGIADVFDFWAETEDRALLTAWQEANPRPERIRDKITWLVRHRIEQLAPHREAARRATFALALPVYAGIGPRLAWRTAGVMWSAIGDRSLDGNFYSKRMTLSAVYVSTMGRWLTESSEEGTYEATWDFLDSRIGNVMQFEKTKATVQKRVPSMDSIAATLAKIRYGNRSGA